MKRTYYQNGEIVKALDFGEIASPYIKEFHANICPLKIDRQKWHELIVRHECGLKDDDMLLLRTAFEVDYMNYLKMVGIDVKSYMSEAEIESRRSYALNIKSGSVWQNLDKLVPFFDHMFNRMYDMVWQGTREDNIDKWEDDAKSLLEATKKIMPILVALKSRKIQEYERDSIRPYIIDKYSEIERRILYLFNGNRFIVDVLLTVHLLKEKNRAIVYKYAYEFEQLCCAGLGTKPLVRRNLNSTSVIPKDGYYPEYTEHEMATINYGGAFSDKAKKELKDAITIDFNKFINTNKVELDVVIQELDFHAMRIAKATTALTRDKWDEVYADLVSSLASDYIEDKELISIVVKSDDPRRVIDFSGLFLTKLLVLDAEHKLDGSLHNMFTFIYQLNYIKEMRGIKIPGKKRTVVEEVLRLDHEDAIAVRQDIRGGDSKNPMRVYPNDNPLDRTRECIARILVFIEPLCELINYRIVSTKDFLDKMKELLNKDLFRRDINSLCNKVPFNHILVFNIIGALISKQYKNRPIEKTQAYIANLLTNNNKLKSQSCRKYLSSFSKFEDINFTYLNEKMVKEIESMFGLKK